MVDQSVWLRSERGQDLLPCGKRKQERRRVISKSSITSTSHWNGRWRVSSIYNQDGKGSLHNSNSPMQCLDTVFVVSSLDQDLSTLLQAGPCSIIVPKLDTFADKQSKDSVVRELREFLRSGKLPEDRSWVTSTRCSSALCSACIVQLCTCTCIFSCTRMIVLTYLLHRLVVGLHDQCAVLLTCPAEIRHGPCHHDLWSQLLPERVEQRVAHSLDAAA